MTPDDRTLLLRTHRGHEPSAILLWERHGPRLLAHAAAIVGPSHAEDVVQSVLCRLLTLKRRDLRAIADAPAFLATLTRRAALNTLRGERRRRGREGAAPEPPGPAHHDDSLAPALDRLPRRAREVLALKHAGGLTFDQIALALGINRSTAAGRYRDAIADLRTLMGVPPPPRARSAAPAGLEVPCA